MSRYRLSGPALEDIATILAESVARFGGAASERYERLIATALVELASNPERPGSRAVPELANGARLWSQSTLTVVRAVASRAFSQRSESLMGIPARA